MWNEERDKRNKGEIWTSERWDKEKKKNMKKTKKTKWKGERKNKWSQEEKRKHCETKLRQGKSEIKKGQECEGED